MVEHEDFEEFDDGEENQNSNLLAEAVGKLDKTQYIKPPSKSTLTSGDRKVQVKELLNVLGDTAEHADIGRNLRNVHRHKSTLSKPLEKREAEKIRRATGFDEVKAKLDRWNAIVTRNRAIEHKVFPLVDAEDKIKESRDAFLKKYTIASELEKKLESLNPEDEEVEEKHFPLTLAEMIEHRKEAARLRAKQSYKEAKARRQSKIKSKKFHRVQRKEKIKTQLKEFESLQKTNPEEALRMLEQLEKTRAEERVTLRHKSTGHWAKNKLVRAKYDKDTRQQLAQQLAISRELTQKVSVEGESESENDSADENQDAMEDSTNPWISTQTPKAEYADFVSGYKKFWEEQNKTAANEKDKENGIEESEDVSDKPINIIESSVPVENKKKSVVKKQESKLNSLKKSKPLKPIVKKKKPEIAISTSDWNVSTSCSDSVENIFDKLNSDLNEKCLKKINSLKESLLSTKKSKKLPNTKEKKNEDELSKLSFRNKKNAPQIDEELYESANGISNNKANVNQIPVLNTKNESNLKNETIGEIDPNKFVAPKVKHLHSTIPDIEMGDDHFDDDADLNDKQMMIAEAFEDDDIVTNFQQEKQSEIDKDNPQIDDAFLPGWGSWTGKNLAAPKRKRKCFTDTFKKVPRKDNKKDNLIIKEDVGEKLKSHLVSELPFPFTSVKDFESTVRAPIGNTFVPETAFKKLTKPAVLVKTGVVIKPMDESHLLNTKKNDKFASKIKKRGSKKVK